MGMLKIYFVSNTGFPAEPGLEGLITAAGGLIYQIGVDGNDTCGRYGVALVFEGWFRLVGNDFDIWLCGFE